MLHITPNTAFQSAKVKTETTTYTIKTVSGAEHRKQFVASSREFIGQCCRLTENDNLIFVYDKEELVGIASYKLARTVDKNNEECTDFPAMDIREKRKKLELIAKKKAEAPPVFLDSENNHILRYILLKNVHRKTKVLGKCLLQCVQKSCSGSENWSFLSFWSEIFGQKIDFSKLPNKTRPEGEPERHSILKIDFLADNFTPKTSKMTKLR